MRRLPAFLITAALLSALACKGEREQADGAKAPPPAAEPETSPKSEPEAAPAPEPEPPSAASITIADAVDAARYEADLRAIAAPRPPGSEHWQVIQDRCFESLTAAGFTTVRFEVDGAGVSVIGRKDGTQPELAGVVIGAHYDHIEGCAGADDNASGTAAVLELARVLGARDWTRTLTIACWDEEEAGLFGSKVWVDAAVADGRSFALYLNFDAIAYTDATPGAQKLPPGIDLMFAKQVAMLREREFKADFIALLADSSAVSSSARLLAHAKRLELPAALLAVPAALKNETALHDLRRSDHASFWTHDIPAVFLSDTANFRTDTYHCEGRPDTVETLDLPFAVKVVRMAAGGMAEVLDSSS